MDEKKAFFIGVGIHIIFLFTRVQFFPFRCIGECTSIIVADIPISIIYLAFSDPLLIIFSLIFGSILWGFYFWLLYIVFQKLF